MQYRDCVADFPRVCFVDWSQHLLLIKSCLGFAESAKSHLGLMKLNEVEAETTGLNRNRGNVIPVSPVHVRLSSRLLS